MSAPEPSAPPAEIKLSALSNYMSQPGGLRGVTFWPRAFARVIDFAVHYSITAVTGFFFGLMLAIAGGGHVPPQVFVRLHMRSIPAFVLILLGSVGYEAACEAIHGSTFGKLALGMVVVQEDGSPCTTRAAIIRSFAYFIDGLFFGLIAYSAMSQSPEEQRLGDQWAKTVVCERKDLPPASRRSLARFGLGLFFAVLVDSGFTLLALLVKISA